MKRFFGIALKGNTVLEKEIMIEILRLSKNQMFSHLNNPKFYSVLDKKYAVHFGFNEQKVFKLFEVSEIKA